MDLIKKLAEELSWNEEQVRKVVELLDEGNTVPFIARYRKEVTGSMDDETLRKLEDRLGYLRNMEDRRTTILDSIRAQEKLTPELEAKIMQVSTMVELEDLYLPYRPKRKTRGSVARDRGLEPLAELILSQSAAYEASLPELAAAYVTPEGTEKDKAVPTAEDALAGAMDILAEDVSNNAEFRKQLRGYIAQNGVIESILVNPEKDPKKIYESYYEYSEPIPKVKAHRVLAMNRAEKDEVVRVSVKVDEDAALGILVSGVITEENSPAKEYLVSMLKDSYERLIFPSLEREIRNEMFDEAAEGALVVFSENLKNLLLIAPVKGKTVLGFDPGYAHGCKIAVVDKTGKYLKSTVIYPTPPRQKLEEATRIMLDYIRTYGVDIIAVGNGTASRESEQFVVDLIKKNNLKVSYTIVSESGASVYSATPIAQEEFPTLEANERSAISLARRLQDPLAELVKVDPKAIGVGQYQHDMKPARLSEMLGNVVEDCVNSVGVDVNTASYSLLAYVSGINKTIAKNIVAYREENGEFTKRAQLLKVPKLGAKAYEQCAGFLRVVGADEILDNTGVHPESYPVAKALLAKFGYSEEDVRAGGLNTLRLKVSKAGAAKVAAELGCGEPTLVDIVSELEKPGRDVRDNAPAPILRTDVMTLEDLKEGMVLKGTVRNVVDFGCFVDIGVHEDGLLHISRMADRFVKHPRDLFAVGDVIDVKIESVDTARKRISLTRKGLKTE